MNAAASYGVLPLVRSPECGDKANTWMASYRRPLLGFVLPLVNGDRQAAEDIVQETMLRAWQHSAQLIPERAGSWLHTVARNLAISTYHRRRLARPAEVPLDEGTVPVVDDELDNMLDSWQIVAALHKLSREHQVVIVELFYHRRSVAELATLLAIPQGTVRSRCFYGLRALRKALEEQGITKP